MLPFWKRRCSLGGSQDVALVETRVLPCWNPEYHPAGGQRIALLETKMLPCWKPTYYLLEGRVLPCCKPRYCPAGTQDITSADVRQGEGGGVVGLLLTPIRDGTLSPRSKLVQNVMGHETEVLGQEV